MSVLGSFKAQTSSPVQKAVLCGKRDHNEPGLLLARERLIFGFSSVESYSIFKLVKGISTGYLGFNVGIFSLLLGEIPAF